MSAIGPLLLLIFVPAAVFAWLAGPALYAAWRRSRIRRQPFPAAWRAILRKRMPAYARLPADLQLQLRKQVQVLLADIPFIGCAGLVVSDEMRVLIAAQAALLLLNRGGAGFPGLRQVLVYPGAFVVERSQPDGSGLTHDTRRALSGESWQQGQVLLSWDDVLAGAANPEDGHNVVIHEFAHQLDQEKGRATGAPWLALRDHGGRPARGSRYTRWAAVLGAEYAALQRRVAAGEDGLIDAYGASDPAEFFAVVSEHFFEQPAALAAAHPALFTEFMHCYRTDPRAW